MTVDELEQDKIRMELKISLAVIEFEEKYKGWNVNALDIEKSTHRGKESFETITKIKADIKFPIY